MPSSCALESSRLSLDRLLLSRCQARFSTIFVKNIKCPCPRSFIRCLILISGDSLRRYLRNCLGFQLDFYSWLTCTDLFALIYVDLHIFKVIKLCWAQFLIECPTEDGWILNWNNMLRKSEHRHFQTLILAGRPIMLCWSAATLLVEFSLAGIYWGL